MNYRFIRVKLCYQWNKQLSQTCCVRLIEHIQILNCRDPSHNHWAMTLGFIRYTAVFRKYERPQFVTTVISEKLATSNDCKHNIICVEVCQNKNIQSNWTYSMQTSSSWIFRSTQYMQRLCVFILDCLAWHLSADNLWHIWCQSAITFLIKKKRFHQIMTLFFRWQEMLVTMQPGPWFVGSIIFTVHWIFGPGPRCLRAGG